MNTSYVLILAVVCFFIGIIVTSLVQSLREEKEPADEELPPTIEEEPVMETPLARPTANMIEVARIWKDKYSLRPVLEMEGDLYRNPEDVQPAQLEKLNAMITELCDWLGQPPPTHPSSAEAPAFLTSEPFPPPIAEKPSRRGPLELIKNSLEADVRSSLKSAPKSLAAQVDEILQEKLGKSAMADRGIRIMDTPSADLVVMVGLSKYDGIDAVPDPEIQSLIREAVTEWGRRASLDNESIL